MQNQARNVVLDVQDEEQGTQRTLQGKYNTIQDAAKASEGQNRLLQDQNKLLKSNYKLLQDNSKAMQEEHQKQIWALQEGHQQELEVFAADGIIETHRVTSECRKQSLHELQDLDEQFSNKFYHLDKQFSSEAHHLEIKHAKELTQQLTKQRLGLSDAHEAQLHLEKLEVSQARCDATKYKMDEDLLPEAKDAIDKLG